MLAAKPGLNSFTLAELGTNSFAPADSSNAPSTMSTWLLSVLMS
jgi:hypothetical protein